MLTLIADRTHWYGIDRLSGCADRTHWFGIDRLSACVHVDIYS